MLKNWLISRFLRLLVGLTCGVAWRGIACSQESNVEFNRDVRPILVDACLSCHGLDSDSRQADLRLDRRELAIEAGAIVPGDPDASEVVRRILSDDEFEAMPPPETKKHLTSAQKATLVRWIREGAKYELHWSLVPPTRAATPTGGADTKWIRNPIDSFVLAKLQAAGLSMAPEANGRTLARRASLDITGLPPTPVQLEEFLADRSPDAYEKYVDRLLESPRWGEHRARYWLDAARYGDTHGLHGDNFREVWSYREWVIDAFNKNMSFDEFTIANLAGDLLPNATLDQQIASGFNRCNVTTSESGSIDEEYAVLYTRDRTETSTQVWLGLTTGCAVCHDHKFDPLSQKEFYELAAFFNNTTQKPMDGNVKDTPPVVIVPLEQDRARWQELGAFIREAEASRDELRSTLHPHIDSWPLSIDFQSMPTAAAVTKELRRAKEQIVLWWNRYVAYHELSAKCDALHREWKEIESRGTIAHVMQERDEAARAHVLNRGEYDQRLEEVTPNTPAFLPPFPADLPRNRLGFAQWLLRDDHPLTARVTVNRFWQEVFGQGLVRTAGDFGVSGELPSHPELLDWLAVEFRESGWDAKHLFRLMLTSSAYRQSAIATPEKIEKDSDNRLLSRGPRFRMDAEMVRDYALATSGILSDKIGGPSVRPYQPSGVWEAVAIDTSNTREYVLDSGESLYRRSIYTFWKRSAPPASMEIFNAPSREFCVVVRERTNTPLQALVTLNDPQFIEAARLLSHEAILQSGGSFERCLSYISLRLLARELTQLEREVAKQSAADLTAYYAEHQSEADKLVTVGEKPYDPRIPSAELAAWTMLVNQLMNLDEVLNK